MRLSIVIVNYNVKYFLEQCLHSVMQATQHIEAEVFVVDNNSVDGSVPMLRQKFPGVHLIANRENVGFSRANNQALRKAAGDYVVLLNPDTIVEEDTFTKILDFMDAHPEAGGLGVKMLDGKGRFLPESKRGLPTPLVAFYKIFGISSLFPKSRRFGKYHLSYLDPDTIHEVDILAGAFMLIRRSALEKTGLLDETFFMYGEDIDLSYRIRKAGYRNYYFPETRIIHYKGESTKKGSVNYVLVFYNAMLIFARKHFSRKRAGLFSLLIRIAVYFRAGLSLLRRFAQKAFLPFSDFVLIYAGYRLIIPLWEHWHFGVDDYYPPEYQKYVLPAYILVWLAGLWLSGGYRRPVQLGKHLKGIGLGTLILIVGYALLNEAYRFSRALLLMGTVWAFASTTLWRFLLHALNAKPFLMAWNKRKRLAIVGNAQEKERVKDLLDAIDLKFELIGVVAARPHQNHDGAYLGTLEQLPDIVKIHRLDELIFCASDMRSGEIISQMLRLSDCYVDYKIAPPQSFSVIGSSSIHTAGELYAVDLNSVALPGNRRSKRLFDFLLSALLLLAGSLFFYTFKSPAAFYRNLWHVFRGKATFVGYNSKDPENKALPSLKPGILNNLPVSDATSISPEAARKINMLYAKDYRLRHDLWLIARKFYSLDSSQGYN